VSKGEEMSTDPGGSSFGVPPPSASAATTATTSWQDDGRLVSMVGWAQECLKPDNAHVLPKFFATHKEQLEELLADRKKFR